MVNKVMLIGNTGMNPEVKRFDNGNIVARLTLATSKKYKSNSGKAVTLAQWHNLTIWGRQAEVVEQYVKKGDKLYVEGEIVYEKYTDANSVERIATKINVSSLTMLGGSQKESKEQEPETRQPSSPSNPAMYGAPLTQEEADDLPF